MREMDIAVIGGGPAGMAAALAAWENGVRDILILERGGMLGGILPQCIHNGFGLHRFGEELTGPEYAARYERQVQERGIPVMTGTTVLELSRRKVLTAVNPEKGVFQLRAKAVILAMGCRERPRGALNIPGTRPSGIYSAGSAQKLVNLMGYLPGREVVILGSGDIGLIMARRMTLEGARVHAVCEVLPYPGGLGRNIEQCLNDFQIPLYLSHTVTRIDGRERLEGVEISQVDGTRAPIPGTQRYLPCDTLLLSVGLIPENELTQGAGLPLDPATGGAAVDQNRETALPGVFACGNVLQVHDLVDFVSKEGELAGSAAAGYVLGEAKNSFFALELRPGAGIRYVVPQRLTERREVSLYFRVARPAKQVRLLLRDGERVLLEKRKNAVAPGEMETLVLTGALLEQVRSGQLRLELESEEEGRTAI